MLTIRMVVVTIIGIFTTRIVLSTLGIEDYGVYGVAGSFIGLLSFLNSTMTGTTNRFLCVEMGKSDSISLSKVFSSALMIHICIALFVFILSESIGVWFLNYKLDIPEDRLVAANWVFQCSVFSVMIGITQTPYSAVILANERMNIYAYFEILNTCLKLLIVVLLLILPGDKLIVYAILVMSVSIFMQIIIRIYCRKHFPESHFKWHYEKEYFVPMIKYSVTDLYGNICIIGYEQSRPILLNLFFGVIYNAAASLAYTVQNIVWALTASVIQAFKPQIFKLYSQQKIKQMQIAMENAQKFNALAFALLCVPCIFETPYILYLWLGQIPPHTTIFLRIILVTCFISALSSVSCIAIHASGKIKRLSYITGSLYIMIPIIVWIAFKNGAAAYWLYVVYGIILCLISAIDMALVKRNIPDFCMKHFIKSVLVVFIIIAIATTPNFAVNYYLDSSFYRIVLSVLVYSLSLGTLTWFFVFTSDNRLMARNFIENKFRLN